MMKYLPDNTRVTNRQYVAYWRDIYEPLEKALGIKVWAFDPDVLCEDKNLITFRITRIVAERIVELYKLSNQEGG